MGYETGDRIYLHTDRYAALADFICRKYGLEVPLTFVMPTVELMPDTNEGLPFHHRVRYYYEGGTGWPARLLVKPGIFTDHHFAP